MKASLQAKPRRILVCVHSYPDGGGIQSIVEAIVGLLTPDYEVHVAVIESDGSAAERLGLPSSNVHVRGFSNAINPAIAPASCAYLLVVSAFLRQVVRSTRPSAILVQDALNLPCPALVARRGNKIPVVVMDHGTLSNTEDARWRAMVVARLSPAKRVAFRFGFLLDTPWRAARIRIGLRAADAALYVGDELAPWFERWGGAHALRYAQPAPNLFVVPTASQRAAARAHFGLDDSQTVVNMVTRLDGEKGLWQAIETIRQLAFEDERLVLLVAGSGSLEGAIRSRLTALGLETSVSLLGRLETPDVERLHHASDFHLYAGTIGCGMSVALLEAAKCGVLPIVSDVPSGHRSFVRGGGWVFPAGDQAAMTRTLRDALATSSRERERRRAVLLERLAEYEERSFRGVLGRVLDSYDTEHDIGRPTN